MKKTLALILSVLMILSIIPLGVSAVEVEEITSSSNAHDVLKTAIAAGINGLNGTAWSVKGGKTFAELSDLTPAAIDVFKYRSGWNDVDPGNSPNAYVYYKSGNNYNESIAAYEQSEDFVLADTGFNGNIPQSGIILRHSDVWLYKYMALTYTAEADGRIRLYDPTGADITAVRYINNNDTGTLDTPADGDGVYSKRGTIAIYKNDTVLWSKDLNANSRHFAWPEELQNISVNKGDTISIVTDLADGNAVQGLLLAMNPQVSYLEQEIGDLNNDGYINIIDLVVLKKAIASSKFDVYGDLDGNEKLAANDIILIRQYLLGIIDVFPVTVLERTKLVTTSAKTYMANANDEALPIYGVFIRDDQIKDENLETYFSKAHDLGFQTVIVPVKWCWIEGQMDAFNFSKVDTIYSYLDKYDLDIQLLWYGSDNCGYYYDNVPAYIRNNTTDYPLRTRNGANALDYSNALLVAREVCAITALMNHIADIDTSNHTLAIQIENEVNSVVPGSGDSITKTTSALDAEAMHFAGGQKTAILNLINQLGLAVKASRYPCVTRVSLASYECYNENSTAKLNTVSEILALDGIDIVGTNCFEPDTNMDNMFLTYNVGQEGNLPHIAEAPAGYSGTFLKVLNSFSLGGGMLLYQLNDTGVNGGAKSEKLSIYATSSDFAERDGKQQFTWNNGTYYYAATSDWVAFNAMIKAVGNKIAETATTDTFKVINALSANGSGSVTIDDKTFGYNTSAKPSDSYGTVGFVMKNDDGSFLLYSLKGDTSFTLPSGATATGGHYENGNWATESNVTITSNTLTISNADASTGTVYRITF